MNIEKILSECLEDALGRLVDHPRFRHKIHFSYIYQDGKRICMGENVAGNPPDSLPIKYFDYSLVHAEAVAYIRSRKKLNRKQPWIAINIRLNRQGVMRMAAPCPCCFRLMTMAGCERFFFTTDAGFASLDAQVV
jgi:hypothetical protein